MNLTEKIYQRLTDAFIPLSLILKDDSAAHIGHLSNTTGGKHYSIHIISNKFTGLPRIARHRMIYNQLNDLIPNEIHALSIHSFTPEEHPNL